MEIPYEFNGKKYIYHADLAKREEDFMNGVVTPIWPEFKQEVFEANEYYRVELTTMVRQKAVDGKYYLTKVGDFFFTDAPKPELGYSVPSLQRFIIMASITQHTVIQDPERYGIRNGQRVPLYFQDPDQSPEVERLTRIYK